MKKSIKYILFLGAGILIGIVANRNREYLINAQFIRNHWVFRKKVAPETPIVHADKTMIFLAFGQSNSANFGDGGYTCKNEVYNYYKGKLYHAEEPLLGADGGGCSVWTRVADMLIDSGLYKKVIIVPCGIGSTSVDCWSEGPCKIKLQETLDYLNKDSIKLTHIFWEQGETDNVNRTTKAQYKTRLKQVIKTIRDSHFSAPFFSSITSYFPYNNDNPLGIDPQIADAQKEVIRETKNVTYGPNTDSLNLAFYRVDGVHFTENGLDRLAYEWFKKIKAHTSSGS
jgi:hypothetical protein